MASVAATSPPLYHQQRRHSPEVQFHLNVSFHILRCNFTNQTLLTSAASNSSSSSSNSSSSRHAILVFVIPLLVNLIEIKYQGKLITPFETHPATTMVAITSIFLYCLAYAAHRELSSSSSSFSSSTTDYYSSLFRSLTSFSTSLSLVSLALILLPNSNCIRFALYGIYVLISMGQFYGIICRLFGMVHKIIVEKFVDRFQFSERRTRPLLPRSSSDVRHYMLQTYEI